LITTIVGTINRPMRARYGSVTRSEPSANTASRSAPIEKGTG
jgi:hypothetical protein